MGKRLTKAQREEGQRAALRAVVRDLAIGAWCNVDEDESGVGCGDSSDLESVERWVRAVQERFDIRNDSSQNERPFLLITDISEFASIDSATDWLFENGVRA